MSQGLHRTTKASIIYKYKRLPAQGADVRALCDTSPDAGLHIWPWFIARVILRCCSHELTIRLHTLGANHLHAVYLPCAAISSHSRAFQATALLGKRIVGPKLILAALTSTGRLVPLEAFCITSANQLRQASVSRRRNCVFTVHEVAITHWTPAGVDRHIEDLHVGATEESIEQDFTSQVSDVQVPNLVPRLSSTTRQPEDFD
mmetsp:Transcript_7037/g.12552  ORF Transcript_7037/g.12552 Transcript_7037/m.12552 type:complete len:203 (+) Transcript_7037:74-682(+)